MIGAHNQDFRIIPLLWRDVQGSRALDVGCGEGLYVSALEERGAVCVGMDLQMTSLIAAKARAGGNRVRWVRGDAQHLPFRDGVFKLVVCVEVLTHLAPDTRRRALGQIKRVCSPDYSVFVTFHNRDRLTFSRWARLQRSRDMYPTSNLSVWPTVPKAAREMASQCSLAPNGEARHLNFHSRFTHGFYTGHPRLSALVILIEDLMSRLPLLRRLSITFLQVFAGGDRDQEPG